MYSGVTYYAVALCLLTGIDSSNVRSQPNFVFILADDLGWNDIGIHNPAVLTPNIDRLATESLTIDKAYSLPVCSPSRTSLLSGRYSFKTGTQYRVLLPGDYNNAFPEKYPLLQEQLKKNGYRTHLVGKWHLGDCKYSALPTSRGFDTFTGFLGSDIDQYNRDTRYRNERIYDFFNGSQVLRIEDNTVYTEDILLDQAKLLLRDADQNQPFFLLYSSGLPHTPLDAPDRYLNLYSSDIDPARRTYLGMVSALDDSIGQILEELETNNLKENTIVIFMSDNGAVANTLPVPFDEPLSGNNYPLRSSKGTLYEGAVRVPAMIRNPFTKMAGKSTGPHNLFHITDWYPTILDLAGVTENCGKIDGVSQTRMLSRAQCKSARDEMVIQINDLSLVNFPPTHNTSASLIWRKYKIITGPAIPSNPVDRQFLVGGSQWSQPDEWRVNNISRETITGTDCGSELENSESSTCLFNLLDDPYETVDISSQYPKLVTFLKQKIEKYRQKIVTPINNNPAFPLPIESVTDDMKSLQPGYCN